MPQFSREVEIKASPEVVWEVLTSSSTWKHWFPGIDEVTQATGSGRGATFSWRDGDRIGSGKIVRTEVNERLEISTQLGDDQDLHIFTMKPDRGFLGLGKEEGCELEYTLDTLMGGGILANFVAGGNPKDALRVKRAMDKLKTYVETQHT